MRAGSDEARGRFAGFLPRRESERVIAKQVQDGSEGGYDQSSEVFDSGFIAERLPTMPNDKRKYPRAKKDLDVRFVPESVAPNVGEYLDGLAADIGLGGMFITTGEPPAPGAVVALELDLGSESGEHSLVRARAVVRWTRQQTEPEGMGVEFIEFDGLKDLSLEEFMSRVLEEEPD